jgi:hypothetical protein
MEFRETQYGFVYGAMRVERIVAEEKIGVVIEVSTEHHCYQLRASPRGRVLSCTKNEPVQKEEE